MSSYHPTSINISLTTLSERGENPNLHGDGWGVAFYEGNDVRLIKDAGEAKDSEWVELIKQHEIQSHDVIAHIRKSTIGEVSYRNTHPFIRELNGRVHTFAHNGTLKDIENNPFYKTQHFRAVGNTDSEHAFCVLMDRMVSLWGEHTDPPSTQKRLDVVTQFAREMRNLGTINFLYSDGATLFAHGHKRHDPLTNKISWPGLHYLQLECTAKDTMSSISMRSQDRYITLFASVPLNDSHWKPLREGEVIAVNKGEILISSR